MEQNSAVSVIFIVHFFQKIKKKFTMHMFIHTTNGLFPKVSVFCFSFWK